MSNESDTSQKSLKITDSSFDFLWLAIVAMSALLLAFILPVVPNDYWWYMRVAQETLHLGHLPTVDIISTGQPIVYFSWLSSLLFLTLYNAGGITLTVLVRGIIIALAYAILWVIVRKNWLGPMLATLLVILAILVTSNNWVVRPQMFTYFLFAASLGILIEWNKRELWWIWFLPLIAVLWINLHGSFILLFLLMGAALVFGHGNRKSLLIVLGISLLATLLNPHGLGAWRYILTSLTVESNHFSAEWKPPVNDNWQMNIFFIWLLAFVPLAAISKRKLDLLQWVWFLGFGLMALFGTRYVIWFVFILITLTSDLLSGWNKVLPVEKKPSYPALNIILGTIILLLPLAILPGIRESWWEQAPETLVDTPVAAVEWLSSHPQQVPAPMWNDLAFGSYLAFALPTRSVWIHPMFEAYAQEHWEDFVAVNYARYDWQSILDKDGITSLMLSVANQQELLSAVHQSEQWCQVYEDDVAVIFVRRSLAPECTIP
jgi:hypothetical protein